MTYKFDQIAYNLTAKRKPTKEDMKTYIGLEHLVSGSLNVEEFGSDVEIKGEKLIMTKGDVLLGKRNAYLRRAAIAPHDGLFSAHGMILRPKEDVINKDYFPFFIASDIFFDEAIRISVGGLSPTINWKDLKELEFDLPSIEEQKVLADKLWAAYKVKESYRQLLSTTDEMLNAKFHKMFGTADMSHYSLNDVAEVYDGTHQTPNYVSHGIRFVSVENVTNTASTIKYISREAFEKYKHKPQKGDLLMTRIGSIGKCAVVPDDEPLAYYVSLALIKPNRDLVLSEYLKCYIESVEGQKELYQRSLLKAFPMKINLGEIGKIKIILPSLKDQQRFVDTATQAEATKASLRASIEAIDRVIRSLINQ